MSLSREEMKRKREWSVKYFVIEINNKLSRLLCYNTTAARKEYNICRHHQNKHTAEYLTYTENRWCSVKLEGFVTMKLFRKKW